VKQFMNIQQSPYSSHLSKLDKSISNAVIIVKLLASPGSHHLLFMARSAFVQGFVHSCNDILLLWGQREQQPSCQTASKAVPASGHLNILRLCSRLGGVCKRCTDDTSGHRVRDHLLPCGFARLRYSYLARSAQVPHHGWTTS
jgi:hypothetical protein